MLYEFFLKRKLKKDKQKECRETKIDKSKKKKKSGRTWVDLVEEYDALLHK